MTTHAKRSLSGSKRRYACPGSVVLEDGLPDQPSKYAAQGTAMHELARWCLTEGRRAEERIAHIVEGVEITDDMADLVQGYADHVRAWAEGQQVWIAHIVEGVEITDDMADLVQGYVDHVRAWAEGQQVWIETRVDVSEITGQPEQFGTADCIILRTDGELIVLDLKTGYKPVSPVDNTQLMLYALGALNMLASEPAQPQEEEHADLW